MVSPENRLDFACGAVTPTYPNYLRWVAEHKTPLVEVSIFGNDHQIMVPGIDPYRLVIGTLQPHIANVNRVRIEISECGYQAWGEIFVEEESHAGGEETSFRSRSAAKARQARMSSDVRSGKS